MISKAKQNWTVGAMVRLGFSRLIVVAKVDCGHVLRDAANSARLYLFRPYQGCESIDLDTAENLIVEFQVMASSDPSAWAKATKDAHDHKARELGGIGCHLEQFARVD